MLTGRMKAPSLSWRVVISVPRRGVRSLSSRAIPTRQSCVASIPRLVFMDSGLARFWRAPRNDAAHDAAGSKENRMPFEYVSVDDAITRSGLRMVVAGGVPNPWSEAAKGILHIEGIDWVA